MAVAAVASHLVCMVSKPQVQLGMLKAKVKLVKNISMKSIFLSRCIRWMLYLHISKSLCVKFHRMEIRENFKL